MDVRRVKVGVDGVRMSPRRLRAQSGAALGEAYDHLFEGRSIPGTSRIYRSTDTAFVNCISMCLVLRFVRSTDEVGCAELVRYAVERSALVMPEPSEQVLRDAVRISASRLSLERFADSSDRRWLTARVLLAAGTFVLEPPRYGGWDALLERQVGASKVMVGWTADGRSHYRIASPGIY